MEPESVNRGDITYKSELTLDILSLSNHLQNVKGQIRPDNLVQTFCSINCRDSFEEVGMCKRLVILVVVFAFVLSAPFAFAQGAEGMKKRHGRQMMKAGVDRIKARLDELTKELNLTPEQQVKIKEILTKSRDNAKVILEEAKTKVRELRIKAHDEIRVLLTEEQKKKFQELRKKHEVPPKLEECN